MVTRLGLYGGSRGLYGSFAGKTPGIVVVASKGGRSKKRYVVEVDGQLIQAASISDVEAVLAHVRQIADESAERDVKTPTTPKPPKVKVRTGTRKSTSATIQREVKRTQKVVNQAYTKRAREISQDREISNLMLKKIAQDENDTILLLM